MPARPKPLSPLFLQPRRQRRHADFVLDALPEAFGDYHEPFLGGGAVAVALMERSPQTTFHLSNTDPDVILAWQALQLDVDELVRLVAAHRDSHSRAYRSSVDLTDSGDPLQRAARFLYLRGSAADRPTVVFDEANVRGLARLLRNRDVRCEVASPYSRVAGVREEDLVYFDPPFSPQHTPQHTPQNTPPSGPPGPSSALPSEAGRAEAAALVREARSLVNTLTARGAYLLAPEPAAARDVYASTKTMSVVADRGDDDLLWANGTLARAARRSAEQARREL